MTRNLLRIVLVSITATLLIALSAFALGTVVNNLPHRSPPEPELRRALDKAIRWLVANRAQVEADPNPILWWMLASANAELPGDSRLASLVVDYQSRTHSASLPRSPWRMLFDGPEAAPSDLENSGAGLPGYNVLFFYGLSCNARLADMSAVRDEFAGNFCPSFWILAPHCATHQLMGLLWSLQNRCDGVSPETASKVIRNIRRQLTFDFRVDDTYVQRALMLATSGDWRVNLKPVWISRIIDAQLEDGGWDGDARLFPLTASEYLITEPARITIREPSSNFHTTAQSLWLIAHMLSQHAVQSTGLATWYQFPSTR